MNKQAVFGWVMYDWANSAYATIIMTTVMPIFYSEVAGKHLAPSASTAYWGYTQSISLILVVLITPVLGAIADSMHNKKSFLAFFTGLGISSTLCMFTINEGEWLWASVTVVMGTVAFSGANIFYDAFLNDIAPEHERDRISSRGYQLGYLGGGILLALNLFLIQFHNIFSFTRTFATQVTFLTVAVWWWVFSIPMFRHVQEKKAFFPSRFRLPLDTKRHPFRHRHLQKYKEIPGTLEISDRFLVLQRRDQHHHQNGNHLWCGNWHSSDRSHHRFALDTIRRDSLHVPLRETGRPPGFQTHIDLHLGCLPRHCHLRLFYANGSALLYLGGHGRMGTGRKPGVEPGHIQPADSPGAAGGIFQFVQFVRQICLHFRTGRVWSGRAMDGIGPGGHCLVSPFLHHRNCIDFHRQ